MILAVLAGAAIAVAPFLPWVDSRGVRPQTGVMHTSIAGLFRWDYVPAVTFLRSVGLVILVCGVLVILGALVASRFAIVLFSLLALGLAGTWFGLLGSHYSGVDLSSGDVLPGGWLLVAGGVAGVVCGLTVRESRPVVR